MKIYLVGGAVRDWYLGLEVKDQDFVVVGSTPEKMKKLGYKRVGGSFPVFLHPKTGEEYALARTERKSGHGYAGFKVHFDPSVTLEEDLQRRDFTMNAMALLVRENGFDYDLVDPYGGRKDIEEGVIRHVSYAFKDDPLRVLRAARFAARYNFEVASDTMSLMRGMAKSGELGYLKPERVWQELTRVLGENHPERFFEVLRGCDAMKRVFPMVHYADMVNVDRVRDPRQRMMVLFAGSNIEDVKGFKVSKNELHAIRSYQAVRKIVEVGSSLSPQVVLRLFDHINVWKDSDTFVHVIDAMSRVLGSQVKNKLSFLVKAYEVSRNVGYKDLSEKEKASLRGPQIREAIYRLKDRAIRSL